ncbi:MAG: thioesterase [Candidatus Methanoplasma sp.]|jgi:predicted thioesterase|nr:thioesterase [Candidatus Methanoplasma sp.]
MLETGVEGVKKVRVTGGMLASAVGSGMLPVFATPEMILLIEMTASESVAPLLGEGQSTVGARLDVRHSAPSVEGAEVECRTRLAEVDGRRLAFEVEVRDEAGAVGSGTHERFVVDGERFMSKAMERAARPRP